MSPDRHGIAPQRHSGMAGWCGRSRPSRARLFRPLEFSDLPRTILDHHRHRPPRACRRSSGQPERWGRQTRGSGRTSFKPIPDRSDDARHKGIRRPQHEYRELEMQESPPHAGDLYHDIHVEPARVIQERDYTVRNNLGGNAQHRGAPIRSRVGLGLRVEAVFVLQQVDDPYEGPVDTELIRTEPIVAGDQLLGG